MTAVGRTRHILARWLYLSRTRNAPVDGQRVLPAFGKALALPLLPEPDLAADPADSLCIARDFWRRNNLNDAINRGDFRRAHIMTNWGTAGIKAVVAKPARLFKALA
jgi:predicted chitinase